MSKLLLGSHVSMKAPKMFLGSVEEALSYGENTFMIYTGAPQNTRRKPIEELNIAAGKELAEKNSISPLVIHAPYVVNLGNTIKPENYKFIGYIFKGRNCPCDALGATQLCCPGAHVEQVLKQLIAQIAKGLNEVIQPTQKVQIALETMSGKGTEVGITLNS